MKKTSLMVLFTAGIQFAAWAVNVDTFNNTTGLWSDSTIWTNGIVPGAEDVARLRVNASVTLNSESGNIGQIQVGIFNTSLTSAQLTVTAGGTLRVLTTLNIAQRADTYGTLTVNGGSVLVAGPATVGGSLQTNRSNATGFLQLSSGSFVTESTLSVGISHADDTGISGTVTLTGGVLECNALVAGSAVSSGTINLSGGRLVIRSGEPETLMIADGNGIINLTDGILEWRGGDHAGHITAAIDAGAIHWEGVSANRPYDTWDYSFTNANSVLYVYRDTKDLQTSTFVWSAAVLLPEQPAFIVNTRLGSTHGNWNKLTPWNDRITVLRIPGGSIGQWTWGRAAEIPQSIKDDPVVLSKQIVVTDAMIQQYAVFAAEKGVETYYALNINDSLANQTNLLNRFLAAGVNITHVELGNETYLQKFRNGGPWGTSGFVRKITLSDYTNIASSWLPVLSNRYPSVKRLIVGSHNGDAYRIQWNAAIRNVLQSNPSLCQGVIVHLYVGEWQQNEEESVGELFSELETWNAWSLPIHITESGDQSADYTEEGIQRYKTFQRRVYEYLEYRNDGSRMGTHLLYGQIPTYASMYGDAGATPLGLAALDYPYEPLDTDQDGIPDGWERLYFNGPTNAAASNMAASEVHTIYQAYLAGLDPANPASVFCMSRPKTEAGVPLLQWQAVSGRVYSVYWTPDLSEPFSFVDELFYPENSFQDVSNTNWTGFYKLDVRLSP